MAPVRMHRPQLWLLIPLGWVMVGVVGHWLVIPMVLVTIFIGGGLGFGGCRSKSDRREQLAQRRQEQWERRQEHARRHQEHWERHQEHFERHRARWEQSHGSRSQHADGVDLAKHDAAPTLAGLAATARIPADIRERAQRLDRECTSTLIYLREHGAPADQVFEVEQIQSDFGPQALRSYLALAPGTEDTTEVLDGKTGHQLVVEQLDLLLAQVDAQLHRASRLGSDELLANHRFLTEKFGRGDSELTI
ncbi:hypothetical protein [Flexivirga caeni]|uniref:Uncharacterized protein n=1 Tax=Flexivirga caeni TaxID=2294115 RepID=A0A3M9M248_9MICO|nr:hypothetical protein [Flexivirga caeni]RNI19624.1 hypothetical protein EFY87_16115 [Flexivirga caeni]